MDFYMTYILQTLVLSWSVNYTLKLKNHQFSVYLCRIGYEDFISSIIPTC